MARVRTTDQALPMIAAVKGKLSCRPFVAPFLTCPRNGGRKLFRLLR